MTARKTNIKAEPHDSARAEIDALEGGGNASLRARITFLQTQVERLKREAERPRPYDPAQAIADAEFLLEGPLHRRNYTATTRDAVADALTQLMANGKLGMIDRRPMHTRGLPRGRPRED